MRALVTEDDPSIADLLLAVLVPFVRQIERRRGPGLQFGGRGALGHFLVQERPR